MVETTSIRESLFPKEHQVLYEPHFACLFDDIPDRNRGKMNYLSTDGEIKDPVSDGIGSRIQFCVK